MLTHLSTDPKAARVWRNHERRIRNVRAECRLIRSQNVSAYNLSLVRLHCRGRRCLPREANGFPYSLPILLGDVRVRVRAKPIGERVLARHFRVERVRVTRGNYSMKNIPDRIVIRFCCLTNFQHRWSQRIAASTRVDEHAPKLLSPINFTGPEK